VYISDLRVVAMLFKTRTIRDVCMRLDTLLSSEALPSGTQDVGPSILDAIANGSEFSMEELNESVIIAASERWIDSVNKWTRQHNMPNDFSTIHENLFENCLNVHEFVSDESLYSVGERLLAYSLFLSMDQENPTLKEIENICSNYMDLDLELTHEIWVDVHHANLEVDIPLWHECIKSLLQICKEVQKEEISDTNKTLPQLNFDIAVNEVGNLVREYRNNQKVFWNLRDRHAFLMDQITALDAYLLKYSTYKSVAITIQGVIPNIVGLSKRMHDRIASFLFFESVTKGACEEADCIYRIQGRLHMLGKRTTIKVRKQQAQIKKSTAADDISYSSSEANSDPSMDLFDDVDDLDAFARLSVKSNTRLGRRGYKTLGYGTVRHTFRRRNTSRFQQRSSERQAADANAPPLDDGF
jgi:hypothetical protein